MAIRCGLAVVAVVAVCLLSGSLAFAEKVERRNHDDNRKEVFKPFQHDNEFERIKPHDRDDKGSKHGMDYDGIKRHHDGDGNRKRWEIHENVEHRHENNKHTHVKVDDDCDDKGRPFHNFGGPKPRSLLKENDEQYAHKAHKKEQEMDEHKKHHRHHEEEAKHLPVYVHNLDEDKDETKHHMPPVKEHKPHKEHPIRREPHQEKKGEKKGPKDVHW